MMMRLLSLGLLVAPAFAQDARETCEILPGVVSPTVGSQEAIARYDAAVPNRLLGAYGELVLERKTGDELTPEREWGETEWWGVTWAWKGEKTCYIQESIHHVTPYEEWCTRDVRAVVAISDEDLATLLRAKKTAWEDYYAAVGAFVADHYKDLPKDIFLSAFSGAFDGADLLVQLAIVQIDAYNTYSDIDDVFGIEKLIGDAEWRDRTIEAIDTLLDLDGDCMLTWTETWECGEAGSEYGEVYSDPVAVPCEKVPRDATWIEAPEDEWSKR
jgi:hypothetical protein